MESSSIDLSLLYFHGTRSSQINLTVNAMHAANGEPGAPQFRVLIAPPRDIPAYLAEGTC